MQKYLRGALLVALVLAVASMASAYTGTYVAGAGVVGSPHDISRANPNLTMGYAANPADPWDRVCIYCHSPHNSVKLSAANGGPAAVGIGGGDIQAGDAFTYLPLWNHALTTNLLYDMYYNGPGAPQTGIHASQAVDGTGGVMGVNSNSLLCLSCHDGSVAVNTYGNTGQPTESISTGGALMGAGYQIGKDAYLGNHHPIGFDYDAVAAVDTEIFPSATVMGPGAQTIGDHLYGGKLECGSCHAVHNKDNTGERLLWVTDTNSALCLTCHDK